MNKLQDILKDVDLTLGWPEVCANLEAQISQLVDGCIPKEIDYRGNGSEWNDCITEIRNNLKQAGIL